LIVTKTGNQFLANPTSFMMTKDHEYSKEMEQIVYSGIKLNIGDHIDEVLDEDQQEEMHDYFLEEEDLRLYRLKFISEVAN